MCVRVGSSCRGRGRSEEVMPCCTRRPVQALALQLGEQLLAIAAAGRGRRGVRGPARSGRFAVLFRLQRLAAAAAMDDVDVDSVADSFENIDERAPFVVR